MIPSAGGFQETTCLALFDFPLWLTTISPNRVSDELRDVLKRYRREAKQVLFDHFVTRQRRTELQLAATHTHLLAQYPRWAKLATLIKGGATEYLVFKRSNMTREQFDAELKEMERCGLLDPTRFRPWGKDTVQQERDQARVDLMLARDRIAELEGSRHG